MRSRHPEIIAGARADAAAPARGNVLQPPRRISHAPNLLWWIALAALGAVLYQENPFGGRSKLPPLPRHGSEHEAFLALSFGKLGQEGPDVIPAAMFRDQLAGLKSGGYHPVSLRELESFFRTRRPLPERPVLLMFEGVQRDSIEIADAALAANGFHGVAFADVDALSDSNIDLVSTHRLHQMVASERWDIGISACTRSDPNVEGGPPTVSLDVLRRASAQITEWTDHPVSSVSCERFLGNGDEAKAWNKTLSAASLSIGFVVANPGANYVDDSPFELRRLRIARDWRGEDLVKVLDARLPKRSAFRDEFDHATPSPSWVVDRGQLKIDKGSLQLAARPGDNGALLTLAGSERWADAEVEVAVDRVSDGQLWIALRSAPKAFVRLGVVHGRAVLQQSDANGETHDMGSRAVPSGKFVLKLRIMGGRAIGSLDGEMLGDRPVDVPPSLRRGPVAIAVWDPKGSSSARISRVTATPLGTRAAIVAPHPGEGVWEELRQGVAEIAVLSPRQFGWARGRASEVAGDAALAIFARHHRLELIPAVTIESAAPFAEADALRTNLLRWAKASGVDGLNLIVAPALAFDPGWQRMLASLRTELDPLGRRVIVTLVGASGVAPSMPERGRTFALPGGAPKGLEVATSAITFVGPTL